jgi:hypothetical protein
VISSQGVSRIFLTFSTFENSIPSSILGDGVCMSIVWKHNISSSDQNTSCPVWYSGVLVLVGTITLSGQFFWILIKQSSFSTCKGTSNIWIQLSQYKFTFKYIMWIYNFREFIRFFQKGLNPFKILRRFKFEFVL